MQLYSRSCNWQDATDKPVLVDPGLNCVERTNGVISAILFPSIGVAPEDNSNLDDEQLWKENLK